MWGSKKVIITGIKGFIGTNLAAGLEKNGAIIFGIDRNDKKSKYELIKCDLANRDQVIKIISRVKPDVIFHLSGQPILSLGEKNPNETFESNVISTYNILEAVRISHKSNLIFASTREVYDDTCTLPYTEDSRFTSRSIYRCTKAIADSLVKAYFESYNLPVAIVRASNTYGPNDFHFERLIPKIIKSILKSERLELWGDGTSSRDYVFVQDLVRGYILLAEKLLLGDYYGEAFNFSEGKPTSVKEIVENLIKISGSKTKIDFNLKSTKENDVQYSSYEKAKKMLGWQPHTNLKNGLKITYEWYKNNL